MNKNGKVLRKEIENLNKALEETTLKLSAARSEIRDWQKLFYDKILPDRLHSETEIARLFKEVTLLKSKLKIDNKTQKTSRKRS